ncbi:hypothetical protein [Streptomyces daliensis]|uniref:Uncharacterized protein n=1 Tax=Streptomyces daliensis TaxID=299421 RepID=A0A8T4IV10_9ACTN|nr:hypothetical protein [Streptomyces daliensis]
MSEWSWDFLSSPGEVLDGLSPGSRAEVERIARRLADAAAVKHVGEPLPGAAGSAPLQSFAEGPWMVWFMEYRVRRVVYIVSVQNALAGGGS